MQPVQLCIFWGRRVEETYDKAQRRKVKQMQPMRLCLFLGSRFKETYDKAQWSKVKQMHPVWVCIILDRIFEETFKNAYENENDNSVIMDLLRQAIKRDIWKQAGTRYQGMIWK